MTLGLVVPAMLTLAVAIGLSACDPVVTQAAGTPGPTTHATTATSTKPDATTAKPAATTAKPAATTTTTRPPLAVVNISPPNKAQEVGPSTPVIVTYNRPPSSSILFPSISPAVSGQWSRAGAREVIFTPSGYWEPGITYRVSLHLSGAARTVVKFTTRLPSVLVLQQYLAILGYLPLRFTPNGEIPNRKAVLRREPTTANMVPQVPAAGVFTWAYPSIPASLWEQWHRAEPNVVTTAAVMQFEAAHGLAPDGVAGPLVWHALLTSVAKRQMNAHPYNYIIVSESIPETLYVWQDGKFVYHTLTNTGVPGAATPLGTSPIAYKQNPNLMKGCDVNGSCYSVWVAYASYFLPAIGDAIHAYSRPGYGYPQSNGCVEVPPSVGSIVYGYDPVGTLVTVTSWVGPAQHG
jgi:peptidoglycan hydrolase-like protein with peptidoglycan-binding domain